MYISMYVGTQLFVSVLVQVYLYMCEGVWWATMKQKVVGGGQGGAKTFRQTSGGVGGGEGYQAEQSKRDETAR